MNELKEHIDRLNKTIDEAVANTAEELEKLRIELVGKKGGAITALFNQFREFDAETKRAFGKTLNELKKKAESRLSELKGTLSEDSTSASNDDLTKPAGEWPMGSRHPISLVKGQIIDIFSRIGFTVSEGPEIEDDWHNFTALNFPEEHPARDMQDTFFISHDPDIALRTHTSSVQVRVMESSQPPIRTISPGRVFRNEAISARAHCIFHQVEGLYIDKNVSFADLKQTLQYFAREMFGADSQIRLRPSYFPFTEPSAELDVSCTLCKGEGCNVCKYSGWLEILGCGMVDPNVLENCNIDSKKYTGFAFGMGVERIAQIKYRVKDLRLYFENDIRFLEQFKPGF